MIKHNGKLDLCCGNNKKADFTGIDQYAMPGVDHVYNLLQPWPIEDGSVTEIYMSHALEHFTGKERVLIFNEMYRVLSPGAKADIITPHWSSHRAYGDMTHQWPPVSEMSWFYLNKEWRLQRAPHTDHSYNPEGYQCDFSTTWIYYVDTDTLQNFKVDIQFALTWYKDAILDMHATIIKQ